MNPLTNMKNVLKLSEQELETSNKTSWHDQYRDSAWIFIGGLPYELSEGDIICIFSQYGEIVNINLIRSKDTGKSKGFCFMCYEDQRSTVLAVDNFNGIKILNRTIRVDHVAAYKVPKESKKTDEETKKLYEEGCAPKAVPVLPKSKIPPRDFMRETIADQIEANMKLPARLPIYLPKQEKNDEEVTVKEQKKKKRRKEKKKKKKKKSDSSDDDDDSSSEDTKGKHSKITKREGRTSDEKKYDKVNKGRRYDRNEKKRKSSRRSSSSEER